MARLGFGGYEARHAAAEPLLLTRVTNSDNIDTGVTHGGGAAARMRSNAGAVGFVRHRPYMTAVSGVTYFARVFFRVSVLPDASKIILSANRAASTAVWTGLTLWPDGTVRQSANSPAPSSSDTLVGTIVTGTWYCLELSVRANGTTWVWQGRLDGVPSASTSSASIANTDVEFAWGLNATGLSLGWSSTTAADVYFDDWIVNDDTGASNNSWPGIIEQVALLLPTADSAVSSNWTLGNGTAVSANAYDSVNNTPPTGKASGSAGAGDQIKNAVNDVTSPNADADFTMQTYTAAGLASGDTVAAVQAVCAAGPGTSASQNVGIAGVSNPAITEAVGATENSAVGTFGSNWLGIATAPLRPGSEPAHGTAPVVRVGRRSATTNALHVAFVGLYVAYNPAPTPGTLAGTASLALSSSGTLHPIGALAGTSALVLAASATMRGFGALAGSSALTLAASATLRAGNAVYMTGTAPLVFGASGDMKGTGRMEGDATLTFGIEGGLALLLSPRVSEGFTERWHSGQHVGAAKPGQRVMVRTGRFNRRHAAWEGAATDGLHIPGIGDEFNSDPWQAFWEPFTDYVEIPNVREVRLDKSTSNRGLTTATIVVDNIFYRPEEAGHHSIKRGYLAPLRGFVGPGREQLVDEQGEDVEENEWFGLLSRQAQVTVWQSYGDEEAKTFTGLIDDVDTTSRPDVITLTLRCFGQVLVDERIFGWNKEPLIKDPVTFEDRDAADTVTTVGYEPDSSSIRDGDHTAEMVLDGDGETSWRSGNHTTAANTEWVEIRLPEGRYSDYYLNPEFDGMDVWVSLQAKELADSSAPTRNGVDITPNVWLGSGSVPGSSGGIAYIVDLTDVSAKGMVRSLGDEYVLGADSILRIHFRNLHHSGDDYFAGVTSLRGRQRRRVWHAFDRPYVLTDDATDIVRQILRWAGFKEWAVESANVPLKKPFVANRGMSYMDVIDQVAEAIGYTFFIGDPSVAEDSIGVPVFRSTRALLTDTQLAALEPPQPVETIRDSELLTAVDVKQTDEPLSYIIRVRGRGTKRGQPLGGSDTRRVMFTFRPPWAHQLDEPLEDDRMGGVLKHVIHTNNLFRDADDVKFGAYFIALQEAMASVTAVIEFPAWPGVDLDDQLELLDLATGVTGRLLVTDRSSTFTRAGAQTTWRMTVSGALLDHPDFADMVAIYRAARRS